jgi:hypothetical protein
MASVEGGHPPVTRELEHSVHPRTAGGEVAEGETGCLPGRYGRERCLECRSRTTEPPQPSCVWCQGCGEILRPWSEHSMVVRFRIRAGLLP